MKKLRAIYREIFRVNVYFSQSISTALKTFGVKPRRGMNGRRVRTSKGPMSDKCSSPTFCSALAANSHDFSFLEGLDQWIEFKSNGKVLREMNRALMRLDSSSSVERPRGSIAVKNQKMNFEIFVDSDKVKGNGAAFKANKGKPQLGKHGTNSLNANVSKSYLKQSDKGKKTSGCNVKISVGRKVLADIGNVLESREGKSSLVQASRAQTRTRSGELTRRYVKPAAVKAAVIVPKTQTNSSNSLTTMKTLNSIPDALSKVKLEQEKASELTNDFSAESPSGATDEDDASDASLSQKKSNRRNSFTSSLIMSRSKLSNQTKSAAPLKPLPHIYDQSNHLDVFEYVDDIYRYYWVMEVRFTRIVFCLFT
ncbi:hypothetical protein M569_11606 [Genlisea aurea]|uniref:Uncharacterized protein n=1 Tax=Genlisea aurea TaxID=192259 RepID=S8C8N4_9LAMI|nr:hypothetical protein M569_11606 [Genlisea aurea]